MFTELKGHLSLQEMVQSVIDDSRQKIASSEGKDEKKDDSKAKKLLKYEKKEHGHIPSVKEEEAEKKASINVMDGEEVEKLASALDTLGEQFIKEAADAVERGGESKNGGESLPVMKPVAGKQSNIKDSSKAHNIPMSSESQKGDGGGPAKTQVKNDHAKAPGGAPYPAKGVMKTAAEKIREQVLAVADAAEAEESEKTAKMGNPFVAGAKGAVSGFKRQAKENEKEHSEKYDDKKDEWKEEKKASAVDFILDKIANVEKKMGGETLDSKSGEGPKPPSDGTNGARSMIGSNEAATNAKKVQAKAPQKKLMSQVLTEPMQSKAHDHKVSENLRNASKGGVKIAAARELISKIAAEGCTCEGKGECKHCKMKKAMEKKSMGGGMPMGGSSVGSSMPGMM